MIKSRSPAPIVRRGALNCPSIHTFILFKDWRTVKIATEVLTALSIDDRLSVSIDNRLKRIGGKHEL